MRTKAILKSDQITGSKTIKLKNIVSLSVSNYSATATTIKVNNVNRTLPALDIDFNIPFAPFLVEASGYEFDIEISTINAQLIVLDYATLTKEC